MLKLHRYNLLLPLALELFLFCISLSSFSSSLLNIVIAFPALFIIPGAMLLTILIE